MRIRLNGEELQIREGTTLETLLEERKIPLTKTAVEIGGEILGPQDFDRIVSDGDEIVVVRFVGGG